MRIRHKKLSSNFSKRCVHEITALHTSFSEAGNIVVNKKCEKCGQVLYNYIFEPSIIEKFDNKHGWVRVKDSMMEGS